MNRHYPQSIQEVWISYEWLLKEKLEQMDFMARRIYGEMALLRVSKPELIREFMEKEFAKLWNRVAEDQEESTKYRRGSE